MTAKEKIAKLRQACLDITTLADELDCEWELDAKWGKDEVHTRYTVTVWVPGNKPEDTKP